MLKACAVAAVVLVGGATLVAAQGPEHGKQRGSSPGSTAGPRPAPQRSSPPTPRAAPPHVTAPQRPAARAPQTPPAAAARGNEATARRAAEQHRAVEQQRRGAGQRALEQQHRRAAEQQQRANERREAAERKRASERQATKQRAAEQRRSAQQQRENEQKKQSDRQREQQAAERRAAEQQRAAEQKRATERANPALRHGANQPVTARHEQLRQERAKLSRDQHIRLRQAFTINRDRVTRVQFTKRVGTRIPRSVRLFAIPAAVLAIFPIYRDYRYVVEEDTICIVDPDTYEIVDVLDEGTYGPSSRPQVAELTLTARERTLVLDSIPPDFPQVRLRLRLALGAEIPTNIEIYEFAPILLDQVPKLRDFRFIVSQDQVVIVAPLDRSILLVLDR
jgi:Protein of unknown function (DUF1236)